MGGILQFIGSILSTIFAPVLWLLQALRWLWVALLAIGIPIWIYVAFIADEPVFTVENDVDLGRQTVAAIAAEPEEYPLLSREDYPEAYAHLARIAGNVVRSPEIKNRQLFAYDDVKIIQKDDVLNAFCTPGGFIYVYSGLIRYLDAEDHLAGVLGHEIAHAERRHSSLRLQREFGTEKLLDLVILSRPITMGNVATATIVKELTNLKYSRKQEAESDAYSVRYLASTKYACDGTAGFFEKLLAEGEGAPIPEFLSDHPDPAARVTAIQNNAQELGCSTKPGDQSKWRAFQASLPPRASPKSQP